jgi:hypothetical protein
MLNQEYTFPIYRKIEGRNVWYKITSLNSFEEVQQMGERFLFYAVTANVYPEKLRILDMIQCLDPFVVISQSDYEIAHAHIE